MYAGNRIGGSNPLASAIKIKKAFRSFFIFICERMRTAGSPGRRSETKENLFSFCERGGTEGFCLPKSLPDDKASDKIKVYFYFSERGGTEGFCEAKASHSRFRN